MDDAERSTVAGSVRWELSDAPTLWAVSIMAAYECPDGSTDVTHMAAVVRAPTRESVIQGALEFARIRFPPAHGWHLHSADAVAAAEDGPPFGRN